MVLELGRVVAVVAGVAHGEQVGSGLVVAEGLVVTAAHCLHDRISGAPADYLRVTRATNGESLPLDGSQTLTAQYADVAVIKLARPGFTAGMDGVQFARVRREPGVLTDCVAIGYPLFQYDSAEKMFTTAELHGRIHQTDGHESGRLLLRDPVVIPGVIHHSPWGGLSGAVVFHNQRAIGVSWSTTRLRVQLLFS